MSSDKTQKILVIKPSALGDIALAMPALASLRKNFPDAEISWLVRKEFAPLLEMADELDNIILFDRKRLGKWYLSPKGFADLFRFFRTLASPKFDIVIDLQGLFRTALFGWITGCKKRYGMKGAREFAGLFYNHKVERDSDCVHLVDLNSKIIAAAGADDIVFDHELTIDSETRSSYEGLINECGCGGKKYAVLVTGAAHANKCWPVEKFGKLADRLSEQFGLTVITVGTAMDKPAIEKIKGLAKTEIIDLAGKTSIKVLAAVMREASVIVTNDTGPGHIGEAVSAPIVMIFGPTNPSRVGPYKKRQCVAAVDAFTRGEKIESTNPEHSIEKVSVDRVFEKVAALFDENK